jgi:hypothetical protein
LELFIEANPWVPLGAVGTEEFTDKVGESPEGIVKYNDWFGENPAREAIALLPGAPVVVPPTESVLPGPRSPLGPRRPVRLAGTNVCAELDSVGKMPATKYWGVLERVEDIGLH